MQALEELAVTALQLVLLLHQARSTIYTKSARALNDSKSIYTIYEPPQSHEFALRACLRSPPRRGS